MRVSKRKDPLSNRDEGRRHLKGGKIINWRDINSGQQKRTAISERRKKE